MTLHPFYLYIERTEPRTNMARFYALSIEPSLLGKPSLVRRWGRIGTRGQSKIHLFETDTEAMKSFLDFARSKRRRGYHPRLPPAHATVRSKDVFHSAAPEDDRASQIMEQNADPLHYLSLE